MKVDDGCTPVLSSQLGDDGVSHIRKVAADNFVTPKNSLTIGHVLGKDEDFDTSAILSMVYIPKSNNKHIHPTKTCLFYMSAEGPAMPRYRAMEFNGARCTIRNDLDKHIVTLTAQ
ncbi:hypothetical protein SOPP22_09520 [Shewanella sp. OPT22]|nr:hypothetical protein SOPP22_09520 [Shewanella sp. OPT22]